MRNSKLKKAIVFVAVVVALALSGSWLNSAGRLDVPRIFALPGISGGSGESGFTRENHQPPQDAGASQATSFGQGRRHEGGEGDGLNGSALPDVLSNLWFLAVTITVVVYGGRGLSFIMAQMRRRSRTAHSPSALSGETAIADENRQLTSDRTAGTRAI